MNGLGQKAASFVYIGALFLFVTLFGPYAIYAANDGEFQSSFAALVPSLLNWHIGFGLLAIGVIAFLLPARLAGYVACLMIAILALAIIEFTFLVGDTQVIGNVETGVTAEYGGIWLRVGILVVALALALWFRTRLHRFAMVLIAFFAVLQILQIGIAVASTGFRSGSDEKNRDFFAFSKGDSVIHILLDEYQSSFFEMLSKSRFPDYEKQFDGFTFFRNSTGQYPNTHHAMFSIYRDKLYRNDVPSREWIFDAADDSILDRLVDKGVSVELMASLRYTPFRGKDGITVNSLPTPYASYISANTRIANAIDTESELLRQLTLQRMVPEFAFSALGIGTASEAQAPAPESDEEDPAATLKGDARTQYLMDRAQSGALLLEDLAKNAHVGGTKPSYKMLHILTTHNPAALDEQCQKRDRIRTPDWEAMTPQTICVQTKLFEVLNRLREIGVYDNSTIIIHADHGKRMAPLADNHLEQFVFGEVQNPPKYNFHFSQVMSSAMPLLLVKPKGASGPLNVSEAPVSFADIAPTILAAAGAPVPEGQRTVFDIPENEKRTRSFFYYHYPEGRSPYLDRLIEYHIDGKPWLPESWTQANVYLGKDLDFSPQTIDFGTAKDRHYLRDWWRVAVDRTDKQNPRTIAYSMGPLAEIAIRFPDREDRVMTVTMRGMEDSQVVDVTLNGESIGKIEVPAGEQGYADYNVDIPGNLTGRRADQLDIIGFAPERLTNSWPDPKADRMQYGIAVDAISFSAR